MKLCAWTFTPNHYQRSLFDAVRARGIDLRVCYFGGVTQGRVAMGWDPQPDLPEGESFVPSSPEALQSVPDWRERIHLLPGYATRLNWQLAMRFSREGVRWAHWSEPGHPGLRWWLTYPIKRLYGALVNRHALAAFGTGTMALRDFALWGIRREQLAFLPYAPPASDRHAEPDAECRAFAAGRTSFLFVGTLSRRKGVDVLLRAFAKTIGEGREAVLILVGNDTSQGAYRRLASSLGIEHRVLFRGVVPPPGISGVLRCGQVFVLPSRFDGWGVVLSEAASAGLALIGSDRAGAAHHLIEPMENGFLVRAGSVGSLAQAMRAYLSVPALAAEHGARSRSVYDAYAPTRAAERLESVLRSALALRHGRHA